MLGRAIVFSAAIRSACGLVCELNQSSLMTAPGWRAVKLTHTEIKLDASHLIIVSLRQHHKVHNGIYVFVLYSVRALRVNLTSLEIVMSVCREAEFSKIVHRRP